jgi:predicted CXXCH cytochrome family protein
MLGVGTALLFSASLAGFAAHGYGAVAREVGTPRALSETSYAGSNACRSCHPDHTESFRRTFHRTMTQDASQTSVLGNFDEGVSLDYFGVRAQMRRGPAGEFFMTFSAHSGAERWQARVERCVGSRRYQQYLARDGDVFFRLPVAWDIAEQRFIHMNGAFLTPDPVAPGPGASIQREDYNRHVTRWNDNCVFCHNVHPNPGLDARTGEFRTEVAELGIACEACHGPAADHVARNQSPLRRYLLQVGDYADPTIRNPARMSGARSAEVCGRCHGQRLTSDISRLLRDGDSFVPGEELARWSKPLWRDTTQNGEAGLFAARFWNDGTARLTAYEFQGYLQSPCTADAKFSCESCHAMHRGDPRGQMHPERTGNAMCTQCHERLAAAPALAAHAHHDPGGTGAQCVSCHMPRIVYGLVTAHISHRIEVPDPAKQARDERPDACSLCHVDKPQPWAAEAIERWQGERAGGATARPEPIAQLADDTLPAISRLLFAGDPIQRAVAAHALGARAAPGAPDEDARVARMLADVLSADAYPAVRAIALRSFRARLSIWRPNLLPLLAAYSATLEPEPRSAVLAPLLAALGPGAPDEIGMATRGELRSTADRVAIEIGE